VTLLTAGRGVITATDAGAVGFSEKRLQHLVRLGLLVRVARGSYASRRQLEQSDPSVALAIRTRGFVRACSPPTLAVGWSAAALRALPLSRDAPELASVVHPGWGRYFTHALRVHSPRRAGAGTSDRACRVPGRR
jgi:hypothetical protein